MRDLIDHEREMMLDLTGTARPVPQIGETLRVDPATDMPAWPDVPGGADDPIPFGEGGLAGAARGDFGVGRSETHAGSGMAAGVASGCDRTAAGGDDGGGGWGSSATADNEPVRPPDDLPPGRLAATVRMHRIWVDRGALDVAVRELAGGTYAARCVGAVYDACLAFVGAAGPLPLAAAEAWVEGDEAYRARLRLTPGRPSYGLVGSGLDFLGQKFGLPRARLVRGPDRIAELDRVEMLVPVENDRGTSVPAGTQGTVVGVWAGGQAFEVEFWNGVDEYGYNLATVAADGLRLVPAEDTP